MAMFNILEMAGRYRNEWVVLDRSLKVVDHGPDLGALRTKYGPSQPSLTYFLPSS